MAKVWGGKRRPTIEAPVTTYQLSEEELAKYRALKQPAPSFYKRTIRKRGRQT